MKQDDKVAQKPQSLVDWLSRRSDSMTRPVTTVLHRWGVSADVMTFFAITLTLMSALLLTFPAYRVIAGAVLIVGGLFDVLDGALARLNKQVSVAASFLDSILDQYGDAAIHLGLAWNYLQLRDNVAVVLVILSLFGSLLTSYARARAAALGIECRVGLISRVERVGILSLALLTGWIIPALWVLAVLGNITALYRIIFTVRLARQQLRS